MKWVVIAMTPGKVTLLPDTAYGIRCVPNTYATVPKLKTPSSDKIAISLPRAMEYIDALSYAAHDILSLSLL